MNDAIKRLGDLVAVQDEHSHVDGRTRQRMCEIILDGDENEALVETAGRISTDLPADALTAIVADWLVTQTAI